MNSIDWKDWYKKRDKETVCEVFKVKSKQLRKILDLLENSFPAFLLDQQPNTWSEFFKSLPFFSSLLGSLTYSSRFLQHNHLLLQWRNPVQLILPIKLMQPDPAHHTYAF